MDHPDATSTSAQTQVNGPMHVTDEEAEEIVRMGQQTRSLQRTCRVCKARLVPFTQDDSERRRPQCVNTGSMPCTQSRRHLGQGGDGNIARPGPLDAPHGI
jgi:hypothetical protein